jgi:hypothetical protein
VTKSKLFAFAAAFILSTSVWAQQPAPLPEGIELYGIYYCNKTLDNTQPKKQSEIVLVYNKKNGQIIGSIQPNKAHFAYIMTANNIARSKRGIFFWAPDKKNSVVYPMLTEPMYLLRDGTLACAPVHKMKGGTDYEVTKEDIHKIILFSKNQQKIANSDLATVADEIGEIATSAWGDFFGSSKQ